MITVLIADGSDESSDGATSSSSSSTISTTTIIDTDDLNADLTLLTLCMLKEHHPAFEALQLQQGGAVSEGLRSRPPCRWENFYHDVSLPR